MSLFQRSQPTQQQILTILRYIRENIFPKNKTLSFDYGETFSDVLDSPEPTFNYQSLFDNILSEFQFETVLFIPCPVPDITCFYSGRKRNKTPWVWTYSESCENNYSVGICRNSKRADIFHLFGINTIDVQTVASYTDTKEPFQFFDNISVESKTRPLSEILPFLFVDFQENQIQQPKKQEETLSEPVVTPLISSVYEPESYNPKKKPSKIRKSITVPKQNVIESSINTHGVTLADKIYLPVRVQCQFRHVEYGEVTVIATLFYIDPNEKDYRYRHVVDDELFFPANMKYRKDYDKETIIIGHRVCMFHIIEQVTPRICPLQLFVGCWFSSFQQSASLLGHPKRGWDAWHLIEKSTLISLSSIFLNVSNTSATKKQKGKAPELVNSTIFQHRGVVNFQHLGINEQEKLYFSEISKYSYRDFLAVLCTNECDVHTCSATNMLQFRDNNDRDIKCKHDQISVADAGEKYFTVFRDQDNASQDLDTHESNEQYMSTLKPKYKIQHKARIKKMEEEAETAMKSNCGQRIRFDTMDMSFHLEDAIHPVWFQPLFHLLDELRTSNNLQFIIPYQFTHFLSPDFITNTNDYDVLTQYFEPISSAILLISLENVNKITSITTNIMCISYQSQDHFLTNWKLKPEYIQMLPKSFMRTSDGEIGDTTYHHLYVPIHRQILTSKSILSQELLDYFSRFESNRSRWEQIFNEKYSHDLFGAEAKIHNQITILLFKELSLFNERNLPALSNVVVENFVKRMTKKQ